MHWVTRIEDGGFTLRPGRRLEVDVVVRARRLVAGGVSPTPAARMEQVHGTRVAAVDAPGVRPGCDGIWTTRRGLPLVVRTADCLPVVLWDGARLAAVHAGWRGLTGGILERALGAFPDPGRVSALLGPAIGPCCFEVGPEVAARFHPAAVRAGQPRPHADLAGEARLRLAAVGVPAAADLAAGPCTRCHQHLLHSYRGSAGSGGRLETWARIPAQPLV